MRITFLGQAGVAVESQGHTILVDPYLTNALDQMSGGFWRRGIPIPVDVREFKGADAVVCTHEHADHLDPLTVAPLLAVSPETRLIAPQAAVETLPWIVDPAQRTGMRGEGEVHEVGPFRIISLPAAHTADYRLEHTPERGHRWCSVVIEADGARMFHSGDTVDWDGFAEAIGRVDVACVSINGRGREDAGIVGNMNPAEAASLCRRIGARRALAMHWDMFPVNPGDPEAFAAELDGSGIDVRWGAPLTAVEAPVGTGSRAT